MFVSKTCLNSGAITVYRADWTPNRCQIKFFTNFLYPLSLLNTNYNKIFIVGKFNLHTDNISEKRETDIINAYLFPWTTQQLWP